MNNGDNKKKKKTQSVMNSVGDVLAITFHVSVERAHSHGGSKLFCKHTNAAGAADANLNIYEPLG